MDYEQGKAMLETHCCSQCEAPLTLIWDAKTNTHELVCGSDRSHEGYKQLGAITQTIARGETDKVLGQGAQSDLEKQVAKAGHPLSMLPDKDIATGEGIARDQFLALVKWGHSLALKPYLGHVCFYRGEPYVTIDGYYYLLNKRGGQLRIGTRPLTNEERQAAQIPEGDHAWIAESWSGQDKLPTIGLGVVTKEEMNKPSKRKQGEFAAPVAHDKPWRMAEKRAEWQLLRKLIPLEEV